MIKKPKKFVIEIILLILIVILSIIEISLIRDKFKSNKSIPKTISLESYKNKDYYIIKNDYEGEYDLQFLDLYEYRSSDILDTFEKKEIFNYSDYINYCQKWGIKPKYQDSNKNYIIVSYIAYGAPNLHARLAAVENKNDLVNLYLWDKRSGVTTDVSAYVLAVPISKDVKNFNIISLFTDEEFQNIKTYGTIQNPNNFSVDKPIIYLYPEQEINVSIKLLKEETITYSYPKYHDSWKVLAYPGGKLIDRNTNRELYALYYESKSQEKLKIKKDGFVVKGEDTIAFLEDKLEMLGLNAREAEEFIIYWLPKLENNKYNYIHFASLEEINKHNPLEITPQPDTIIRVLMEFKPLENPIEIAQQNLTFKERKGFTVVEWGGTQIID